MFTTLVSKGVEQLSVSQKERLQLYIEAAKIEGVVTSVLIGTDEWDLSPPSRPREHLVMID
jgi:hypothetical protein